jgi:arylformamidase
MNIIDLSQPLFDHMPVYPGDPEVIIEEIHTITKEGWNLRSMTLTTHIGTHVNVPYHMASTGKKLDAYAVDAFVGPCVIYSKTAKWKEETGIIFRDQNIDLDIANSLITHPPKFIGLSSTFEFDVPLEKLLLEHNIISFENLVNTEKLPEKFMFYGAPLNLREADGSPVRAFAVIE